MQARPVPRLAVAVALSALLLLAACGGDDVQDLAWRYRFVGADPSTAAIVVAEIRRGGCRGAVIFRAELSPTAPSGMSPPDLPPGTYGFAIRARDGACIAYAEGCADVTVPAGSVEVPVEAIPASPDCLPADCSSGRCPGPDASVCMPSAEVCNAVDDDCDATVDEGFDLLSDPNNCGRCRVACTLPHGRGTCTAGTCSSIVSQCDPGFGNCNMMDGDGCELPVNTLTNCGGCGVACMPANATGSCVDATCAISSCAAGFADCDGRADTGCEADVTQPETCGTCTNDCTGPHVLPTCASGTCARVCETGWDNCNGMWADGCELPVSMDDRNCGRCGNRCIGSEQCCNGACTSAPGGMCP